MKNRVFISATLVVTLLAAVCCSDPPVGGPDTQQQDAGIDIEQDTLPSAKCWTVEDCHPANDGGCSEYECKGASEQQGILGQCWYWPKSCDDGNVCTKGVCESGKGCMISMADGVTCTDDKICTVEDRCKDGKCTLSKPRSCDDGNVCTADSCVKEIGCVNHNVSGDCEDGNQCTNNTCSGGKCIVTTSTSCKDAFNCTVDVCNKATGKCEHTPDNSLCADDGNPCTTEQCTLDTGCQSNQQKGCCFAPSDCDKGDPCVAFSCNKNTNKCEYSPKVNCCKVEADCTDGNKCTTQAVCLKQIHECKYTPKSCDDKVACTVDSCDAKTGKCIHSAQDYLCKSGNICHLQIKCVPQEGGCQITKLKDCNDGNVCTKDSCSEKKNKCEHMPVSDGAKCGDGKLCTAQRCISGTCKTYNYGCCNNESDCKDSPHGKYCRPTQPEQYEKGYVGLCQACSPVTDAQDLGCKSGQYCVNGLETVPGAQNKIDFSCIAKKN